MKNLQWSIAAQNSGKAFFDMLGVFAEFETNLRRERQAEGISAARRKGTYRGRPPKIDMDAIRDRIAEGQSPTRIAREMGFHAEPSTRPKARLSESMAQPVKAREQSGKTSPRKRHKTRSLFTV